MTDPNLQPPFERAAVLMPALVTMAFDYLVPAGTQAGALVEAKLDGRSLVGVVWPKEGVRGQGSGASGEKDRKSVG
jgi:hypothetical protein